MMNEANLDLKMNGIYDLRTLKQMQSSGIRHLGFDFDPKSLNFIQEYVLLDFIQKGYLDLAQVYLRVQNDSMIVSNKLVGDVLNNMNPSQVHVELNHPRYLTQLEHECSIFMSYDFSFSLKEVMQDSRVRGIIIPFKVIEDIHRKGQLQNAVNHFYFQLGHTQTNLVLEMDWDSNLFASVFNYFDFNMASYSINSKVEICYRNADLNLIKSELKKSENLLGKSFNNLHLRA